MKMSIKQKIKDLMCDLIYRKAVPMLSKKKVPYSLNCLDKGVVCFELGDIQAGVYSKHSVEYLNEPWFVECCNTVISGLPEVSRDKIFRKDLRQRYYTACKFAKVASSLEGSFVSVGVSFGVTPRLILEYTSSKKEYWLVDGWDGYDPYRSKVMKTDMIFERYCSNVDDVRKIFSGYDNVRIVQGLAPQALENIEAEKISLLQLDTGDSKCEAASIEFLWDRIVPGGIIVIDLLNPAGGYVAEHMPLFKKLGCSDGVIGLSHGQGIIIKQ